MILPVVSTRLLALACALVSWAAVIFVVNASNAVAFTVAGLNVALGVVVLIPVVRRES